MSRQPDEPKPLMTASLRDICIALFFSILGASSAIGGCYVWHKLDYASSPQAIIDTSGGETYVLYKGGKPFGLVLNPVNNQAKVVKK